MARFGDNLEQGRSYISQKTQDSFSQDSSFSSVSPCLGAGSWIEICQESLRWNLQAFRKLAGSATIAPVLKANAYGHGLKEVFEALEPLKPSWICVNTNQEAACLRRLGYTGRILVIGSLLAEDLALAQALDLDIVLGNQEVIQAWTTLSSRPRLHVKINTGMSRLGLEPCEALGFARFLKPYKKDVFGLCTHFANVEDSSNLSFAHLQLERFEEARAAFSSQGYQLFCHTASSSSTMLLPSARFDLCRIGISLYGLWPSTLTRQSFEKNAPSFRLKPALQWRARISQLRSITPQDVVGYGCTYRPSQKRRIGVVTAGYAEGFPRRADHSQGSYVLVRGEVCPVVGRICMNMLMIDCTHLRDLKVGDPVTLLGCDGNRILHADEMAHWADTISYEIVTRLSPVLARVVHKNSLIPLPDSHMRPSPP